MDIMVCTLVPDALNGPILCGPLSAWLLKAQQKTQNINKSKVKNQTSA